MYLEMCRNLRHRVLAKSEFGNLPENISPAAESVLNLTFLLEAQQSRYMRFLGVWAAQLPLDLLDLYANSNKLAQSVSR